MADFDPYYRWLGIPAEEQPAHHYRLLGLTLFESDRAVIEARSLEQIERVRNLQLVEDPEVVGSVLGALALARSCLLDADQKATCDAQLTEALAAKTPPPLPVSATPEPEPATVAEPLAALADLERVVPATKTGRGRPTSQSRRPLSSVVNVVGIALGGAGGIALMLFLLKMGLGLDPLGLWAPDPVVVLDRPAVPAEVPAGAAEDAAAARRAAAGAAAAVLLRPWSPHPVPVPARAAARAPSAARASPPARARARAAPPARAARARAAARVRARGHRARRPRAPCAFLLRRAPPPTFSPRWLAPSSLPSVF